MSVFEKSNSAGRGKFISSTSEQQQEHGIATPPSAPVYQNKPNKVKTAFRNSILIQWGQRECT